MVGRIKHGHRNFRHKSRANKVYLATVETLGRSALDRWYTRCLVPHTSLAALARYARRNPRARAFFANDNHFWYHVCAHHDESARAPYSSKTNYLLSARALLARGLEEENREHTDDWDYQYDYIVKHLYITWLFFLRPELQPFFMHDNRFWWHAAVQTHEPYDPALNYKHMCERTRFCSEDEWFAEEMELDSNEEESEEPPVLMDEESE